MTVDITLPQMQDLSFNDQKPTPDELVDEIEEAIARKLTLIELPVVHRFTPGLYIREIFMPAGAVLTSRTHKYEHPFVISRGVVSVWSVEEGSVTYRAPHTGITKPGTRRVLVIHEDTIWTTFHVNEDDAQDPDELVYELTEAHKNPRMAAALENRPASERISLNRMQEVSV